MRRRPHAAVAGLLFVAVILVRFSAFNPHATLRHSGHETLTLAIHLAEERQFASPFEPHETGPSAHLAPGFPFIVATIIKFFGDGPRGAYVLGWTANLCLALFIALLPSLAIRMGLPPMTGLLSALTYLIGGFSTTTWEADYVGLMEANIAGLLIIFVALVSFSAPGTFTALRLIATGIVWAAVLQFIPVAVVVLPAWLVWASRYRKLSRFKLLIVVLVTSSLLTPWLVRNFQTFHHFIFIRGNLGLELAAANNSCATFALSMNDSSGCYAQNHPNANYELARLVGTLGEPEFNKRRFLAARHWIFTHPSRFAVLSVERFTAFWLPWEPLSSVRLDRIVTCLATILSIFGLRRLWATNRAACTFLLMWLVVFPISYYFVVPFEDRHRIPILWTTLIPASFYFLLVVGGDWDSFLKTEHSE